MRVLFRFMAPLTLLGLCCTVSFAQIEVPDKFKDNLLIVSDRSEELTFYMKDDSLKAYSEASKEVILQKSGGDKLGQTSIYGSYFFKVSQLKARTLVPVNGKFKTLEVKDFKLVRETSDGVFYDDSYAYTFTYPGLVPGARMQYSYREDLRDPRIIGSFYFELGTPQLKTRYTIKVPVGVELELKVLHDSGNRIAYTKTIKGNQIIHQWDAKEMEGSMAEDNSPSASYFTPQVVCYVKSYTTKSGKVRVLQNLEDLHQWYQTFIQDLDTTVSEEMKTLAAKIKTESSGEEDYVRRVFYWVQDNIRYVAFEDGMRGFIPHSGSYVCEKRFGDCKDMSSILVELMRLGGVKGYYTWVGTRDLPYKYSEFPTPIVDNHMIATYINPKGEYIYLDGTSNHTPYGFPSSMIQGKEVLVSLDKARFEVRTVPVISPEKNIMIDTVTVQWSGNQLMGKGTIRLEGFPKVFNGYRLDRSDEKDVKDYLTRLTSKGSNKFYLDTYQIENNHNQDKATRINYSFKIGDYVREVSGELYVNLHLNKDYYNETINLETRKFPIENDYLYTKIEVVDFKIPEGYEVEYLPPDAAIGGNLVSCKLNYELMPGNIRLHKTFSLNYLLMQKSEFSTWNSEIRSLSELYRESLILKKK